MTDAFIAFMVFLFLGPLLGPVLALLWELSCAIAYYVGLVFMETAIGAVKVLWLLIRLLLRDLLLLARGAWLAAMFLYFLLAEMLRGPSAAEEDGGEQESAAPKDDADLYEAALTLLGLQPGFTRAELDAAFKKAIKRVHPDVGGSVDQAQAVNAARDLLLPRAS